MLDKKVLLTSGEKSFSELVNNSKKGLILFFYPKDNSSGCTKEACSFRDYYKEIQHLGYTVVGVSKDTIKSHENFINKNELNFDLISDFDLELHKFFNVWVEKSMYGKKYMGAERSTFLLNKDGDIQHEWRKVKAADHPEEVYKYLVAIS